MKIRKAWRVFTLTIGIACAIGAAEPEALFPAPLDRNNVKQSAMRLLNAESRPPGGREADASYVFYEFSPAADLSSVFGKQYLPPATAEFKKMLRWLPKAGASPFLPDGGADAAVIRYHAANAEIQIDRNRSELVFFLRPDSGQLDTAPDPALGGVAKCVVSVFRPEVMAHIKAIPLNKVSLAGGDQFVFMALTNVRLPATFDSDSAVEISFTNTCLCVEMLCKPDRDQRLRGISIYAPPNTPSMKESRLDESEWPIPAKREISLENCAKNALTSIGRALQTSAAHFPVLEGVSNSLIGERPIYDDKLGTLPVHVMFTFYKNVSTKELESEPFPLQPFRGATVGKDGILVRIYVTEFALPGKHTGGYPLGTNGLGNELHLVYDVEANPPDPKLDATVKESIEEQLPHLKQNLANVK